MEERIRIGFDETSYPTFGRSAKQRRGMLCEYGFKDDEEGLISSEESEDYDEESEAELEQGLEEPNMYNDNEFINQPSVIPRTRY